LLTFNPEGRMLVGYSSKGISAFDRAGVRREEWWFPVSQEKWIEWHGMAVSADGRFAVGKTDSDRSLIRQNLSTRRTRTWHVGEFIRTVAISPDGRLVAAGTRKGRVILQDAETGQVVLTREVGRVFRLAFSPDGRRLAIGGAGVRWLDVETGK